eukprot:1414101-Prymnesium_polylepis.1
MAHAFRPNRLMHAPAEPAYVCHRSVLIISVRHARHERDNAPSTLYSHSIFAFSNSSIRAAAARAGSLSTSGCSVVKLLRASAPLALSTAFLASPPRSRPRCGRKRYPIY